MRQLTVREIEELAARKGVNRTVVKEFLASMGEDERKACMELICASADYGWDWPTCEAILTGIRLAMGRRVCDINGQI